MGDRAAEKKKREATREENWNNQVKNCDKNISEPEKLTWEEALEGKGFVLKKSELVGKSKYTDVYKAKKKDIQEEIACKLIRLKGTSSAFQHIYSKRNLKVLQFLAHASILKIYKIFLAANADKLYIFMELGEQGNIAKYVKKNGPLKESQALSFGKGIAEALGYLHSLGIAHRRVNSENTFVDKAGRARLGGLEYFQEVHDPDHNGELTPCWMSHESSPYLAPEALDGEPHDPIVSDAWGFGCILYFMLTGTVPFDHHKDKRKVRAQANEKKWAEKEKAKQISDPVKKLLEGILTLDIVQRLSMEELAKDPIFQ